MQEAGRTDEQDKYIEAADLFRETVSKDPEYADAFFYLGFLFEHGLGVELDKKTALNYYQKAANLDHPKGWIKVGSCYATGSGTNKNLKTAEEAYINAARLQDTEAMNLLG